MQGRTKKITATVCICLAAAVLICAAVYITAVFGAISPGRVIPTLTPGTYGLDHENLSVDFAGKTLSGWLIPAKGGLSQKTVIFSHDRKSNREIPEADGYFLMRSLSENGYNIVTFDYLGSGSSGGDFYTFGASEADQLSAIIDCTLQSVPGTSLAVIGWGCGAAAAIKTAERPEVAGVVAESSYQTFDKTAFSEYFSLPFLSAGQSFAETISGTGFSLSPEATLGNISGKNFYFIHCLDDKTVDYTASQALNAAAKKNNTTDLWLIEGGGHCLGAVTAEENYSARIVQFLEKFM